MAVQMSSRLTLVAALLSCAVGMIACAPMRFEGVPTTTKSSTPDPLPGDFTTLYDDFFKIGVSQTSFEQQQLDLNQTSVAFQVLRPDGTHISNLKNTDLDIIENGQKVATYKLNANSKKIVQPVDIVFAVDITGSMSTTIESAKTRLVNFVNKTRAAGHRTRMCLLTFGDYTVKKCDRFYDNNPADPATVTQVNELISQITKLRAMVGLDDPGGLDLNENPMRALIDAASAPWLAGAQRFVILVTDDGFLYYPNNAGQVGKGAPKYADARAAVINSQMKVFAATPSLGGYNSAFEGLPGIVESSQGEWFDFQKMISGTITLDTILNRILDRVQTTYTADYVVEDSAGLDGSLPLPMRQIAVKVKDSSMTANIVVQQVSSNLPNGREKYKKTFKFADHKVAMTSIEVRVNGQVMKSGYELSADGVLEFDVAPAAKAKIEIRYSYDSIKEAIVLAPIRLKLSADQEVVVTLNGHEISHEEAAKIFELKETLEGDRMLVLMDSVLSENDRFGIRKAGGLNVIVRAR